MIATIYTKSACPKCVLAKVWLLKHHFDVKEIDLDDVPTLQLFKANYPYIKSAPAVFINDELNTEWAYR